MHAYPPVTFPPLPPTSNTLSSNERSALVRSSRKLYKILGHVPRLSDDDSPLIPSSTSRLDLGTSTVPETESKWRERKPTHLPPLLQHSSGTVTVTADAPDSPTSVTSALYHLPPMLRGSVLSIAPSIVSNAPSDTYSSTSDASDTSQRRTKIERLRRRLGEEVPTTAVFPTTPLTAVPPTTMTSTSSKKAPRGRTRSVARQPEDARSIAFSVSSDERMHRVTFTTRVHSPHPRKAKHIYQTGALPPLPSIPAHILGDDNAGLIRPRQKVAAGSKIGGSDFKAARRAKRDGRAQNGMAEPGELMEMVGFLRF